MARIGRGDLERLARTVNEMRGEPVEAYTHNADGSYTLNRQTVTISGAYGGWDVVMGDGYKSLTGGHGPAREAYSFLRGMVASLELLLPRDEYGRVTSWDVDYRAVPKGGAA